jgi:hypothetical protein
MATNVLELTAGQIGEFYGIKPAELRGRERGMRIMDVRRIFVGLAQGAGESISAIARFLNRDRSTILHLLRTHQYFYNTYPDYANKVNRVKQELQSKYKLHPFMKQVTFPKQPDLWPEQYTDLFLIDESEDIENVQQSVQVALDGADSPVHLFEGRMVFTDSQLLVDELKDVLYGAEIAFQHTHIPEHYG